MRIYRALALGILTTVLLSSCGSTGSQVVYSPGDETESGTVRPETPEQQRERAEQEQRELAAEQARLEAAREAEQARLAEERAAEAREAERRAEEQRLAQQREAEEAARREAERQRQLAAQRAAEQARVVAAQQARVEELRAQIAANENETGDIEAANSVLRRAVQQAEALTDALMSEEEKYNNTDPVTGEPLNPLATARLQQLADEVEELSDQAEALMASP